MGTLARNELMSSQKFPLNDNQKQSSLGVL